MVTTEFKGKYCYIIGWISFPVKGYPAISAIGLQNGKSANSAFFLVDNHPFSFPVNSLKFAAVKNVST